MPLWLNLRSFSFKNWTKLKTDWNWWKWHKYSVFTCYIFIFGQIYHYLNNFTRCCCSGAALALATLALALALATFGRCPRGSLYIRSLYPMSRILWFKLQKKISKTTKKTVTMPKTGLQTGLTTFRPSDWLKRQLSRVFINFNSSP